MKKVCGKKNTWILQTGTHILKVTDCSNPATLSFKTYYARENPATPTWRSYSTLKLSFQSYLNIISLFCYNILLIHLLLSKKMVHVKSKTVRKHLKSLPKDQLQNILQVKKKLSLTSIAFLKGPKTELRTYNSQ